MRQSPVKLCSKLRDWCTRCEGFEMTHSATKDINWTTEVSSRWSATSPTLVWDQSTVDKQTECSLYSFVENRTIISASLLPLLSVQVYDRDGGHLRVWVINKDCFLFLFSLIWILRLLSLWFAIQLTSAFLLCHSLSTVLALTSPYPSFPPEEKIAVLGS